MVILHYFHEIASEFSCSEEDKSMNIPANYPIPLIKSSTLRRRVIDFDPRIFFGYFSEFELA